MRPNELLRELHEANKYLQARIDEMETLRLREIARIAAAYAILQLCKEQSCR